MLELKATAGLGHRRGFRFARTTSSNARQRSIRYVVGTLLALVFASIGPKIGLAQQISPPPFGRERPEDRPVDLPPLPEEAAAPLRILPPPPPPSQAELAVPGARGAVVLLDIDLVGNTALSDIELEGVVAPYLGFELDADGLEDLRRALTRAYVDAGYVNSGAVIPEQDMRDGVLRVDLVEGRLAEIQILGARYYRRSILRKRLARSISEPLNIEAIEAALRILDQDPRIARLQARLVPGDRRAEARLEVVVEERLPVTLEAQFDNYESPTVGSYGGHLAVANLNLFGQGDRIASDVGVTEGLVRVGGLYDLPLNAFGTSMFAGARYSHAKLIEGDFEALDIKNDSSTFTLGLRQQVFHSPRDLVALTLQAERRWSRSSLLGRSFSFSEGTQNGRAELFVLRAIAEWSRRGSSSVMALRSTFSWGLDFLDPTIHSGSEPDGIFFSWLAQARYLYRFDRSGIEVGFRGDVQLSDRPLLSLEQFPIGGPLSVRGYRTNQLVRDQGLIGSVDVRFPLLRSDTGRSILSVAPFADVGRAWNRDRPTPGKRTLSSVGAGLRWRPWPDWTFEIEWAEALRSTDTSGDLQDDGVALRATWTAL